MRECRIFKKINNGSATSSQYLIEACGMLQTAPIAYLSDQESLLALCPSEASKVEVGNALPCLFGLVSILAASVKEYSCTVRSIILLLDFRNSQHAHLSIIEFNKH